MKYEINPATGTMPTHTLHGAGHMNVPVVVADPKHPDSPVVRDGEAYVWLPDGTGTVFWQRELAKIPTADIARDRRP